MSAPTCVACNKPFPANGELASVPEGRRIAFDPGQRRVWRICTKCGEWNLLGTEAAGAALPELTARDPKPSSSVRSTRVSGDLELLRIDDISKVEVADLVMAEQRDGLQRATQLAAWMPVVIIVLVSASFIFPSGLRGGATKELLGTLVMLAGISGLLTIPRIFHRMRHRASVPRAMWLGLVGSQVGYLLGMWLLEGSLIMAKFLYLGGLPAMIAFSLIPWHRLIGRFLPKQLADVMITDEWDATTIRWTISPATISLRPLGREWLSEDDSVRVLSTAVAVHSINQTNAEGIQHAHALAASLGLTGVLAALDAWRHDRDDTLTLGDIPAVYLVALELAFSREKEASKKALAAHEKLLEAGVVAREAEALDRLPEGS
ncbi:MAG: hypothetical protein SFU84_01190 [Gemmatimonadales bacterium]|nr:hypothetical protein [Gemmatimonadales bacterium]